MRGVDLIGPDRAGVYSNLVPIYSAALGVLILNEAFGLYHFLSITIVITNYIYISLVALCGLVNLQSSTLIFKNGVVHLSLIHI